MTIVTVRRVMVGLSILGIILASYLVYVHYSGTKPVCTAGTACIKVQTSQWSKLAGVPVALMGLIGYIAILASLLAPDTEEIRTATLGMTLDNGNHLVLSGNQAVQRYLALIGASDRLVGPDEARFVFADVGTGERWTIRPSEGLPEQGRSKAGRQPKRRQQQRGVPGK